MKTSTSLIWKAIEGPVWSKQLVGSYRTKIRYRERILDIRSCWVHMALQCKASLKGIMAICYDVTESQLI